MKIVRTVVPLAFALLIILSLVSTASAQAVKIGFVRDDRIQQEYGAWQKAQDQWDLESKAWEEEAMTQQTELQELVQEYEKQKLILSEDKRREREAAIRAKEDGLDAYTRKIYGPNGSGERRQKALIEPILEKITLAIEAVAIENDYDVVFTMQSALGYIKEAYDVTDKVLKYLEDNEE